jgi:hypothetical protein
MLRTTRLTLSSGTVPEVATLRIRIDTSDVGGFMLGRRTIVQMVDKNRKTKRKRKSAIYKPRIRHHVVVTELDGTFPRRLTEKPHLYVELSASSPEVRFGQLQRGKGSKFAAGRHVRLHPNPPKTSVHTDRAKAKEELKRCKELLVREGHAVNNLESTWVDEFVVYVFDLDPTGMEELMTNKDGSRKKGYVYVGQSANPLEVRVEQHRRQRTSRAGKDIGARATKNRAFSLREHRIVYTEDHSMELEKQLAAEFDRKDYLVDAGHVTPRKLRKRDAKARTEASNSVPFQGFATEPPK